MKLHLLAVGEKMPGWVQQAYQIYLQRLPSNLQPVLHEVPLAPRTKNTEVTKALATEGARMLKLVPPQAHAVALDIDGTPWSTEQLARSLERWQMAAAPVALMVGGPDGLAPECLQRADQRWSLGPLTLPHPLVRVLLAEQIYRAFSILQGHPYHRA